MDPTVWQGCNVVIEFTNLGLSARRPGRGNICAADHHMTGREVQSNPSATFGTNAKCDFRMVFGINQDTVQPMRRCFVQLRNAVEVRKSRVLNDYRMFGNAQQIRPDAWTYVTLAHEGLITLPLANLSNKVFKRHIP